MSEFLTTFTMLIICSNICAFLHSVEETVTAMHIFIDSYIMALTYSLSYSKRDDILLILT